MGVVSVKHWSGAYVAQAGILSYHAAFAVCIENFRVVVPKSNGSGVMCFGRFYLLYLRGCAACIL